MMRAARLALLAILRWGSDRSPFRGCKSKDLNLATCTPTQAVPIFIPSSFLSLLSSKSFFLLWNECFPRHYSRKFFLPASRRQREDIPKNLLFPPSLLSIIIILPSKIFQIFPIIAGKGNKRPKTQEIAHRWTREIPRVPGYRTDLTSSPSPLPLPLPLHPPTVCTGSIST